MKATIRSAFACSPAFAWDKVQTSALLQEVIYPLLRIAPAAGASFPARWEEGQSVHGRLYLFGFLPLGKHVIHIERVDAERRQIQSRESGGLIRRWDHLVTVRPGDDGQTIYSDEIEIECGWLTPLVWAFANAFYRHRHRRWKRLIRRAAPAGVR